MPLAAPPMIKLPEYVLTGDALAANPEWLLTNGLGGFAMGTVRGTPTRRYHALFIPALAPPVQREVMLHSLSESVVIAPGTDREQTIHLTPYAFASGAPASCPHLIRFTKSPLGCAWLYRFGHGADQIELEKSVHLHRAPPNESSANSQGASISYSLRAGIDIARLQLRPLVRMQDAHALLYAAGNPAFRADTLQRNVKIRRDAHTLELASDSGWFEVSHQWWYNFAYELERLRGYDWTEDLWSPGVFNLQLRPATSGSITITASLGEPINSVRESKASTEARLTDSLAFASKGIPTAQHATLAKLLSAADDFIVTRSPNSDSSAAPSTQHSALPSRSIIAGYPWFTDWGRDSMISCSGLLLTTGRFEDARSLLSTFASHRRNGLIPNVFNDQTGQAEYNTADASLWFLHAACEYLHISEDVEGFETLLKPACLDVIDAYREGTEFGIRVDPVDGLLAAGDASTQLTWMDAKRDGVVFTPRHGKPVELSALWYSGVVGVADAIKRFQGSRAMELEKLAKRTADHFRVLFWNGKSLHDCLEPTNGNWKPVPQVRPNQIFAASLERSALDEKQRKSVVGVVKEKLLTPRGLRTLAADDRGYKGRFRGTMMERDGAYHNGTVWPWLIGPYAEAVMRVGGFSPKSREAARMAMAPVIAEMDSLCPGQIAEVYDGDETVEEPRRAGGCPAQAWNVGEVLRVWGMSWTGE